MPQVVTKGDAMWETWVRSLGQEDALENEMAIHSNILAAPVPSRVPSAWNKVVIKSPCVPEPGACLYLGVHAHFPSPSVSRPQSCSPRPEPRGRQVSKEESRAEAEVGTKTS